MTDPQPFIAALRTSHDRLAALLAPLDDTEIEQPSRAGDWSIAQVASHLGSQSEIFALFLSAGLSGQTAGNELFQPIWDRWNALPAAEQVRQGVVADETFVSTVEDLPENDRQAFSMSLFGSDTDLSGLLRMRLQEHAAHTWDVAGALDPTATLSADATELLIDGAAQIAARSGKPNALITAPIETTAPVRHFYIAAGDDVALTTSAPDGSRSADDALRLPAEAFLRLLYGRLDPAHTPADVPDDDRLDRLRAVFVGY